MRSVPPLTFWRTISPNEAITANCVVPAARAALLAGESPDWSWTSRHISSKKPSASAATMSIIPAAAAKSNPDRKINFPAAWLASHRSSEPSGGRASTRSGSPAQAPTTSAKPSTGAIRKHHFRLIRPHPPSCMNDDIPSMLSRDEIISPITTSEQTGRVTSSLLSPGCSRPVADSASTISDVCFGNCAIAGREPR